MTLIKLLKGYGEESNSRQGEEKQGDFPKGSLRIHYRSNSRPLLQRSHQGLHGFITYFLGNKEINFP
jgi:hypothetical protein